MTEQDMAISMAVENNWFHLRQHSRSLVWYVCGQSLRFQDMELDFA